MEFDRREALKKAVAVGAAAWTAPLITSQVAGATALLGTPKCRPTVTLSCLTYDCRQGNKFFPGIKVCVSGCPCSAATAPVFCVSFNNLAVSGSNKTLNAYLAGTDCSPTGASLFTNGAWKRIGTGPTCGTIFFGPSRGGNGAIHWGNDNITVTGQLCLFAGRCPGKSSTLASVCQSYAMSIGFDSARQVITSCSITANNLTCGCEALAFTC